MIRGPECSAECRSKEAGQCEVQSDVFVTVFLLQIGTGSEPVDSGRSLPGGEGAVQNCQARLRGLGCACQ